VSITEETSGSINRPQSQQKNHLPQFKWGSRTYLMGVLNVTPDSFSDGGRYATVARACTQALRLAKAGADILDIGGESARPGATPVSLQEELDRVIPVVIGIREKLGEIPISIDTTKAAVAQAAIEAGASWINDISGGVQDPAMLKTVAKLGVPICLMHMRGNPKTMRGLTEYQNLVLEVGDFLEAQIALALDCGIAPNHIIIDPGIGFAKTANQSIELLKNLDKLRARLPYPLLVGVSRKSFIGYILDRPNPLDRIWGTSAACCVAIDRGADILRVHDVAEMQDVIKVADTILR
jgi:dihydropteroate synthase